MSHPYEIPKPETWLPPQIIERIRYKAAQLVNVYNFHKSDVDDIRQKLTICLLKASHRYDPERGALVTFANRILHDAATQLIRDRASANKKVARLTRKGSAEASSFSKNESFVREKRKIEKLTYRDERNCLAQAPRLYRRIAVLHLRGLSKRQIAAYLKIPKSTFFRKTWPTFCTEMRKRLGATRQLEINKEKLEIEDDAV